MGNAQAGGGSGSYYSPQVFVPSPNTNLKGLINSLGENNCFLNVVIQALWHLDSFRTKFEGTEEQHQHTMPSCVFCALQDLFVHYSYSDEFMIPPTDLRRAMSVQFAGESRFKIGEMYDATETLVEVLEYLHNAFVGGSGKDDMPCEPMCLIHQVFSMNFCDRTECPCGATSEPVLSSTFIYPIYVAELRRVHAEAQKRDVRFDELVSIINDSELKRCPDFDISQCSRENRNQRFLQNVPKVFTINLVWPTPTPAVDEIRQTLSIIGGNSTDLDLSTIFYGVERGTTYTFRGMIAYYGRHYAAFFHCRSRNQWLIFDDEKIKIVGNTWNEVISNCCRARWQPSVLFYERRDPRSTRSAAVQASTSSSPSFSHFEPQAFSSSSLAPQSNTTNASPTTSQFCAPSPFTSTSVSAALPAISVLPERLTLPAMHRSHSADHTVSEPSNGNGKSGPTSPSRNYTPTAPINISASSCLGQSSVQQGSARCLMPLLKNSTLDRSLLLLEAEKEMEKEDIVSSPGDSAPLNADDILRPLVASPSGNEVVTSFEDVFPMMDEWHAAKRDILPSANADREEYREMLAFEGKGKEGKLIATATPSTQQLKSRIDGEPNRRDDRAGIGGSQDLTAAVATKQIQQATSKKQQQAFSCEFIIGQVEMREKNFSIKRGFDAFGRRWLLVLERSDLRNDAKWGSDKVGYEGYITVCIQRLDAGSDVLKLSITFECRVQSRSFSFSLPCISLSAGKAIGDPYFICPRRQSQYLDGRKELGLSLAMRLL